MRILLTGADGFVGEHAARAFRAAGDDVFAAVGPGGDARNALVLDVTEASSVRAALEATRPEAIVHLAGKSSVAASHAHPGEATRVNALGAVHLLDAVRHVCPEARVVLVGSGEVYGRVAGDAKATEATPLAPQSPYAASKAAAEILAAQFARAYGTRIVLARPFNHIGAGQAPHFVVPSFAAQIARVAAGELEPVLLVGDLAPVRDFLHVDDVVAAYRLLATRGVVGEAYNVASGVGRTIRSLIDELAALAGVTVRVEIDPARLRPTELPSLIGDGEKLRALGWSPMRSVTDALADALADARARLTSARAAPRGDARSPPD